WENSTIKAHRKIASIHSTLKDELNASKSVDVAVNAIRSAVGNLEKIDVLGLEEVYEERNPRCGKCGKRMKSAGRNQGLRCKKCDTRKHGKIRVLLNRGLKKKTYQVPPSAMRHLSKPLVRVGFIT
ncbi:MAG: hypothetical protein QF673_00515, partial [Candidatus Hydrothermarchaeota archaeon]|nr:hypothetical protein [Candidatus Hydrothermarchaeota archaeon]